MVQIRKSKREESVREKGRGGVAPAPSSDPSSSYDQIISPEEKLQTLQETVSELASDDIQAKEVASIRLQNMLSNEGTPPIDAVVQSGVVPLLVDILKSADLPQLQVVIDSGALPIFVDLLTSVNDDIRQQSLWALGNIAADYPEYRALALDHGALRHILAQINETVSISTIRKATWSLSNFCQGKTQSQFDQVKYALPALRRLIEMEDDQVVQDACWALSYLCDGHSSKISEIIDAGTCLKLVELLSHPLPSVVLPALQTVGNIASGDEVQTQAVIDDQALPRILHLLTAEETQTSIIKDACWTISNITGGTIEQVQAVISAEIFPHIISLLRNSGFDIKKEAAWAVSNTIEHGSEEHIKYLANQGCIEPLCDILTCMDRNIVHLCLLALQKILRVGEAERDAGLTDVNVYAQIIQDKVDDLNFKESTQDDFLVELEEIDDLTRLFDTAQTGMFDTAQTAFGFPTDQ